MLVYILYYVQSFEGDTDHIVTHEINRIAIFMHL